MGRYELAYREEDGDALVMAVPTLGAFPNVPPVIERPRLHCKIVIVSNTDNDLITGNIQNIAAPFDYVITAEQVRAHKPLLVVFRHVLRVLECGPSDLLHVAQGFR